MIFFAHKAIDRFLKMINNLNPNAKEFIPNSRLLQLNLNPNAKEFIPYELGDLSLEKTARAKKIIVAFSRQTDNRYADLINSPKVKQKDAWIYKILDGTLEQNYVLYRSDEFIVVHHQYKNKMTIQLMVIPTDRSLRTLRELRPIHLNLLERMKTKGIEMIKTFGNINDNDIKCYFHYPPSTYHLHLHIAHKPFGYTHGFVHPFYLVKNALKLGITF